VVAGPPVADVLEVACAPGDADSPLQAATQNATAVETRTLRPQITR
jgi:hypothetical protein